MTMAPSIVIPAQAGISASPAVPFSPWDPGLRRGDGIVPCAC